MASRRPSWQRQLLTTLTRLEDGFAALRAEVRGMREDMRSGFTTVAHVVDRNESESNRRIDELEVRVSRLEQSRTT